MLRVSRLSDALSAALARVRCGLERWTLASALRIRECESEIDAGNAACDLAVGSEPDVERVGKIAHGLTDLGLQDLGRDHAVENLVELVELGDEAGTIVGVAVEHERRLEAAHRQQALDQAMGHELREPRHVETDDAFHLQRGLVQLGPNAAVALAAEARELVAQLAEISLQPRQRALDGGEIGLGGFAAELQNDDELGRGRGLGVTESLQVGRPRAHCEAARRPWMAPAALLNSRLASASAVARLTLSNARSTSCSPAT